MCASEVCSGYRRERLSAKEPVAMSELWGEKRSQKECCMHLRQTHTQRRKEKKRQESQEIAMETREIIVLGEKKHKYCNFSAV